MVRLLHVVLFVLASGVPPEAIRAMLRLAPGFLGAPVLLIPAGFADGFVQGALWAAAIGIDLSVSLVGGVGGFRVQAGHFAERFALIIIIALGESIVAIGVGASGLALGTGVVLAAVLGVALAAALWWAYFDLLMLVAERRLFAAKGEERGEACAGRLPLSAPADGGRDHLRSPWASSRPWPTSGIHSAPSRLWRCAGGRPLPCGAQRLQAARGGQRERSQVGGDGFCLALISVGVSIPSLVILAILAGLMCALVAFETMRSREFRGELRAQ